VIVAASFVLALATAVGGEQPMPSASPATPVPSLSAAPVPSATVEPVPGATPPAPTPGESAVPTVSPAPSTSPTPDPYKYRFVPRQPDHPEAGVPQIFAVYLNDRKLHSSGPIMIKVVTSPDVVKVISRSNGREGAIPELAPGDFETSSKLPKIPFIAAGMTTLLEFVASTAEGKTVSVKVPVKI
jgi:hypothetical protein